MDVFDAAKWREAVKLINYGYGGLMIGLLAWLTYLIAGHYTFGTNINPLINATTIAWWPPWYSWESTSHMKRLYNPSTRKGGEKPPAREARASQRGGRPASELPFVQAVSSAARR